VTNPYLAPIVACRSGSDNRRVWIALIPFFIALLALVGAIVLWFSRPLASDVSPGVLSALFTVFIFDLTVCVYVLVKWLRTGVPPDLLSELMMTTTKGREFHRKLRSQPKLDEDEFYEAFYSRSGVPKQLVGQLRRLLESVFGYDLAGLHPCDNLAYVDDEMDFAVVFDRIDRDLKLKLTRDAFRNMECTFDSLLRVILQNSAATGSETSV